VLPALVALALFQPSLTVQTAQVDITPPERLPLGGYTERQGRLMDWGGDPLYARCVLFTYGSWKEAVVSAEMLTIPDSLAREVRKRIPADVHLFLAATHTHCAPDSQMLNDRMTFQIPGIATYKSRWLAWYADKIGGCVNEALSSLDFGSKWTDDFEIYIDEFRLPLNRGRRARAEPDTLATVIGEHFSMLHRTWIPLIAEYAAHPVFHGPERNQTSGDWPGALSHRMRAFYKPPYSMGMLAGPLGDVSPHAEGRTGADRIQAFVDEFVNTYTNVRGGSHEHAVWKPGQPALGTATPIFLDKVEPHPNFSHDYKIPEALAQTLAEKFAPTFASITAFRLGSLAIVGIPGEPTSHIGRRIKEAGTAMGFHSVLVISHVNGWIGYILDPDDYSHGGYEADLSFYGPNEGEHVVEAAIAALRKLRSP